MTSVRLVDDLGEIPASLKRLIWGVFGRLDPCLCSVQNPSAHSSGDRPGPSPDRCGQIWLRHAQNWLSRDRRAPPPRARAQVSLTPRHRFLHELHRLPRAFFEHLFAVAVEDLVHLRRDRFGGLLIDREGDAVGLGDPCGRITARARR